MRILGKIPEMDDNKLIQLFHNALIAKEQNKHPEAKSIIVAIQKEWLRRKELAAAGKYKPIRPEKGLLGHLNYKVGNEGLKTKDRHRILNYILKEELPFIQSTAYMDEWGSPNTKERFNKLYNVIQSLAIKYKNYNDEKYAKAIIEWEEDLTWLTNKD